ncbi:MAG: cytochrome c [Bacteroidota bacterium]|nr:cytochrome c [Bacteroidota bacterium]
MKKVLVASVTCISIFFISSAFYQKYDLAKSIERGKEVYTTYCITCHMEAGNSTPGVYPPLAKSDYLKKPIDNLINIVLEGQTGEILVNDTTYNGQMLPLNYLTDEQVADVLNYVRNSWGNKIPVAITPEKVKALRK